MNEPQSHLLRDILALRYLDAANAGDLDAVAALWDEAARDPELERMLAEIDGTLFEEETERRSRVNASQHLSGGQLAPMPFSWRRHRGRRLGVAGFLAAACLLTSLVWLVNNRKPPISHFPEKGAEQQVSPRVQDDPVYFTDLPLTRRYPALIELAAFSWPLEEKSPIRVGTSIPSELLD